MRKATYISLALLCFLAGSVAGAGSTKAWIWSKQDLASIKKLEAQVKHEGDRYRVQSQNWIVESEVDARFTAEVAQFMEIFKSTFEALVLGLHDGVKIPETPVVLIFDTAKEFDEKFPGGGRGYFQYEFDADGKLVEYQLYSFIRETAERDFKLFYYPVLLHEGTHQMLQRLTGNTDLPAWFNEGVAGYFQFWDIQASPAENLKLRHTRSKSRDALKENFVASPPSLKRLLEVTDWNPDNMGPIAQSHYALSESLIDFMLSSKASQRYFKEVFARIRAREPPIPEEQIPAIEAGWHEHIRSRLGLKK